MNPILSPSREQLVHALYEAAELEHNLMCTYLYAAFSLKDGEAEGLSVEEAAAVARFRRVILDVAIDEMSHLTAVWNITAALGAMPRFGRGNFPLDPGQLPARVVVRLAPFDEDVLQHFIHLERPAGSEEPDGVTFQSARRFTRGASTRYVTPMGFDYDTVGQFYQVMEKALTTLAKQLGEPELFGADPALQLSAAEVALPGAQPVRCLKTAIAACDTIIRQGEGAREEESDSHYCRFLSVRDEYRSLRAKNPSFVPAHPAAQNPVLRPPLQLEGRVWIEDPTARLVVDLANACYQTMLRLLGYSYVVRSPSAEKSLAVELAVELMKAVTLLGEGAARRPAGPANPGCNAGVSFTALRDAAPFAPGKGARRFFVERLHELADGAAEFDPNDRRLVQARALLERIAERAQRELNLEPSSPSATRASGHTTLPLLPPEPPQQGPPQQSPLQQIIDGVETVQGQKLELRFAAKRCIHARFCVTGGPRVFLANVQGPWLHPDAMDVEELAAIARACPSGAIEYTRKDGHPNEELPPVNLIGVREAGPYAVRADIRLDGHAFGMRATLCRCGASKNKPFCDGSHHEVHFAASGEPETGTATDMLPVRNGPLEVRPQTDGPLLVRGNLELISGTGRMVARLTTARLCRCGGSNTKPFCDGTHAKINFRSTPSPSVLERPGADGPTGK